MPKPDPKCYLVENPTAVKLTSDEADTIGDLIEEYSDDICTPPFAVAVLRTIVESIRSRRTLVLLHIPPEEVKPDA